MRKILIFLVVLSLHACHLAPAIAQDCTEKWQERYNATSNLMIESGVYHSDSSSQAMDDLNTAVDDWFEHQWLLCKQAEEQQGESNAEDFQPANP